MDDQSRETHMAADRPEVPLLYCVKAVRG